MPDHSTRVGSVAESTRLVDLVSARIDRALDEQRERLAAISSGPRSVRPVRPRPAVRRQALPGPVLLLGVAVGGGPFGLVRPAGRGLPADHGRGGRHGRRRARGLPRRRPRARRHHGPLGHPSRASGRAPPVRVPARATSGWRRRPRAVRHELRAAPRRPAALAERRASSTRASHSLDPARARIVAPGVPRDAHSTSPRGSTSTSTRRPPGRPSTRPSTCSAPSASSSSSRPSTRSRRRSSSAPSSPARRESQLEGLRALRAPPRRRLPAPRRHARRLRRPRGHRQARRRRPARGQAHRPHRHGPQGAAAAARGRCSTSSSATPTSTRTRCRCSARP